MSPSPDATPSEEPADTVGPATDAATPSDIGGLRFDVDLTTPPPQPRVTTFAAASAATALHILVYVAFNLTASDPMGSDRPDIETLGIEIVTAQDLLEIAPTAPSADAKAAETATAALPLPTDTADRTSAPPVPDVPGIVVADDRFQTIPVPETLEPRQPVVADAGQAVASAPAEPAERTPADPRLASETTGGATATAYQQAVMVALSRRPPRTTPGRRGTVRIAFDVRPDGAATNVRIAQSSGSADIDGAALEAVRGTRFPPPPTNAAAAERSYEIPYIFR